jgi:hypothetical protein
MDSQPTTDAGTGADAAPRPAQHSLRTAFLGVAAVVLLTLGLFAVYREQIDATLFGRAPAPASAANTYVADLDFWQRTPRETIVGAAAYFDLDHDLNNVPMQVGPWVGEDAPETNQEVMILLEPEQYVQRLYRNDQGQYLWLSMVGGRSSQPFHAPDICYDADGWQYNLGSHAVDLPGGPLYGLYLDADKQLEPGAASANHVVFYFYLFPDAQRDLADGIVLFKLTSGRYGTVEETLEMQADFVRHLFTGVQAGAQEGTQPGTRRGGS